MDHHKRSAAILILIVAGQLAVACASGSGPQSASQPAATQPTAAAVATTSSNQHSGTSPTSATGSPSPASGPPVSAQVTPALEVTSTSSVSAPVNARSTPASSLPVPTTSDVGQAVPATRACQLVTQQDAKGALGSEPPKGLETDLSGGITTCTYVVGASSLQLSLTPTGGKNALDLQLAHLPKDNPAVAVVTGIGDHAFTQALGTRAAVNFDKGDAMVVMGLNLAGATTPPLAQLKTLAKAAAERL
jgi:hypothetical protein